MHFKIGIVTLRVAYAVLQGSFGQLSAVAVLATSIANADIILYSSNFDGSSSANLNDRAVSTSGSTASQHLQYGTSATATWSADAKFKADGSYAEFGANNSPGGNNRNSATLGFTPQNGYVYNLTVTTSFTQITPAAFHAIGFFMAPNFTGNPNSAGGMTVWALTRPGDSSSDDQVAHYQLNGGPTGSPGNVGTGNLDASAPSTLRITLDTTGGNGNWSATYSVANAGSGFSPFGSVVDLNDVDIESVGIGVYNGDGAAYFESFELSVVDDDTTPPLITQKSPADNTSGISLSTHIVATFDDNLILGHGNIVIKDLLDGATSRSIAVTDSSQVTLSGKVLTIIPTTPLTAGRNYSVQIAAGAVRNFSNLPFVGIAENDVTTWSFTTPVNPLRIMPLGDSITVGYTNADWTGGRFEFGYRSRLFTLLSNSGYDFRFVGNSTEPWTFRDPRMTDPAWPPSVNLRAIGQDGQNGYAGKDAHFLNGGISSWLTSQDPDIILLKIGTNGYQASDRSDLQTLVNTITSTKPNCHLILAQIMPRYTYVQEVVNYNTWIRNTLVPSQQALGRKVTLVDQYKPFLSNPTDPTTIDQSLFSNAINHPSNSGYNKMAQVWFDAIDALGIGPGTYSHWIRGFTGVGTQTGLTDDPDGDGVQNGVENFFGTHPGSVTQGLIASSINGNNFTFIHPQGTTAADISAIYRWSTDLSTFHLGGATSAGTTVNFSTEANTPSPGFTRVTATVTGTRPVRLFVDIKVTGSAS